MRLKSVLFAAIAAVAPAAAALAQAVPADPGKHWTPTFDDEFNVGAPADLAGFTYDLGTGPNHDGWGNGESETYTNSTANVSVSAGALHLTAIGARSGSNTTYTSGRIRTTGLFSQAYGLFEFRAKLPAGQGLWPALWMMPQNSVYGPWPRSGEIDVMESTGQNTNSVQGSLHTGASPDTEANLTALYQPAGFDTTQFHTYDLKWIPAAIPSQSATIEWYVDGTLYQRRTGGWVVPTGATDNDAPFDQPFYLIMDLAVGGNFTGFATPGPGSYDMQLDYVRAYQATVPEPTAAALATVAAASLTLRRRRRA